MKKIFLLVSLICLFLAPLHSQSMDFSIEIEYKTDPSGKTGEVTITVSSGQPDYQYYITTHDPVNGKILFESGKTRKNNYTFTGIKPGTYLVKIKDSTGKITGKSIVIEN